MISICRYTITKCATVVAFLLLFQTFAEAQIKSIGLPEIRNYRKSEYGGATQNWCADQDGNGNLYFANNNGLLQFDGSSWTLYPLPERPAVRSLKVGKNHRIYVGGYNEFGYFAAGTNGKLSYHSLSKRLAKESRDLIDFIWKIHTSGDEVIFQAFTSIYSYKEDKLSVVDAPERFQFSFMVEAQLYVQDMKNGLMRYREGRLSVLPGTTDLNNTEVWGIFQIGGEQLLITTIDKGLFIYQGGRLRPWATEANDFMRRNSCLGGAAIGDRFIALNSVSDGVIVVDYDGHIIQHINRKKGLQNNTILGSFVDSADNLWLALDNGVAFVNENSPFTFFGFSYELSSVYASVIHDGRLYVATNRGVYVHDWSIPFRQDTFELVEGTTGQAWSLTVLEGELLCGHNRGALVLKGNRVVRVMDSKGYWCFRKVPSRPNIMMGANYSGFGIFERTPSGWKLVNQVVGFDKSTGTFEMDDRFAWFQKDGQLFQTQLSADLSRFKSIKVYKSLSSKDKGIGGVQAIGGKIYFHVNNHFYTYSRQEDAFRPEQYYTGLFSKVPPTRSIFEDAEGNIWYIHGESIGAFMRSGAGYAHVSEPFSNLKGELVANYENVYTSGPRNIFIGLAEGLVHYDPGLRRNFDNRTAAYVRSFSFGDEVHIFGNGAKRSQEYDLSYDQNNVKFTFSAPIYEGRENVMFSYKLEGFDSKWSPWSRGSVKEYTNLHEGDYRMLVRVRNSFGVVSATTALPFHVAPPLYRHPLAYVVYIILAVLAFYYIRIRISAHIRRNKYYETLEQRRLYLEKEARIRQEQYELEKEIERLKNERLRISLLTKDKELVNNSLQVVKKNKILNGIIQKIKDIDAERLDEGARSQISRIHKSITKEVSADKSWKDLEKHIRNVHFDFLKRLKEQFPTISPRELDLATYLLMNMSTKEIAEVMNISQGGVELARYRLRKKLGLTKKENLVGFLMSI